MAGLASLVELKVSQNAGLRNLPSDLPVSLRSIRANGCGLAELNVAALRNLTLLFVNDNSIQDIAVIGQLTKLTVFTADNNSIQVIPPTIQNLQSLETFIVSNNQISEVPNTIGKLKHLTELNVANNLLVELPVSLRDCQALKYLRADNNAIASISNTLALPHLTDVHLESNMLVRLPESEQALWPQLVSLYLAGNRLQALPGWMAQAANLSRVDVSRNALQSLPLWCVSGNRSDRNLSFIDATNNNIRTLPSPVNSTMLTHLYLTQNPLELTAGMLGRALSGADQIITFNVDFSTAGVYIAEGMKGHGSCSRHDDNGGAFCVPRMEVLAAAPSAGSADTAPTAANTAANGSLNVQTAATATDPPCFVGADCTFRCRP